eukprot:TRINITY_DN8447_c0_g1_i1.p1 TRINITY_DN8447_c0_g1~~TRINITY_DN8447_c0_g1_i1.p1  ORF type:complete len:739 (-),score=174.18 TRINITY_DN8447_c0_g1_i1:26-2242(-)
MGRTKQYPQRALPADAPSADFLPSLSNIFLNMPFTGGLLQSQLTSNKHQKHPLANVVRLSEIEEVITRAMYSHGLPCSIDKIFDFAWKSWGKPRRRTLTDVRRIVRAALRGSPRHGKLFSGDDEERFTFCTEILADDDKDEDSGEERDDAEPDNDEMDEDADNDDADHVRSEELSPVQKLVADAIEFNNGSASTDEIQQYVAKHWHTLRRGEAGSDPRRAVTACLGHNQTMFRRDSEDNSLWITATVKASLQDDEEEPRGLRTKRRERRRDDDEDDSEVEDDSEPQNRKRKASPVAPKTRRARLKADELDGEDDTAVDEEPPVADMQLMIGRAIRSCDGAASFTEIYDYVSKYWGSLVRHDGTQYSVDCKRTVQATLAIPNTNSLFRKDSRRRNKYTLTKKAIEQLGSALDDDGVVVHGIPGADTSEDVDEWVKDAVAGEKRSLDEIYRIVARSWSDARKRDGSLKEDGKTAVLAALKRGAFMQTDDLWHSRSSDSDNKLDSIKQKLASMKASTATAAPVAPVVQAKPEPMEPVEEAHVLQPAPISQLPVEAESTARSRRPRKQANSSAGAASDAAAPVATETTAPAGVISAAAVTAASSVTSGAVTGGSSQSPTVVEGVALTPLQELLCRAIVDSGGVATVEAIQNYVAPHWQQLKKPGGTSYTSDYRRAVLASLSHPAHGIHVFVRDQESDETMYRLSDKKIETCIRNGEPIRLSAVAKRSNDDAIPMDGKRRKKA